MKNTKVFITFGAGKKDYSDAVNRITKQAQSLNVFDKVIGYGVSDLKDNDFWSKHGAFMANARGFGYWLWKPYLLIKTLNSLNDGDIVLYCDAGCELDATKARCMQQYFTAVDTDLIVGGYTCHEQHWTKRDLLIYLGMDTPEYYDNLQRRATTMMIKKCEQTMNFLSEWLQIATIDNYHYLNDSPSIVANYPSFREHRHDQSIFSLLTKKYKLFSSVTLSHPICNMRNRTGRSRLRRGTKVPL